MVTETASLLFVLCNHRWIHETSPVGPSHQGFIEYQTHKKVTHNGNSKVESLACLLKARNLCKIAVFRLITLHEGSIVDATSQDVFVSLLGEGQAYRFAGEGRGL